MPCPAQQLAEGILSCEEAAHLHVHEHRIYGIWQAGPDSVMPTELAPPELPLTSKDDKLNDILKDLQKPFSQLQQATGQAP